MRADENASTGFSFPCSSKVHANVADVAIYMVLATSNMDFGLELTEVSLPLGRVGSAPNSSLVVGMATGCPPGIAEIGRQSAMTRTDLSLRHGSG